MFSTGLLLYRNNELAYAEREFESAIKQNDRDARYWYFLGLSRLALGNTEQANKDFREGAERRSATCRCGYRRPLIGAIAYGCTSNSGSVPQGWVKHVIDVSSGRDCATPSPEETA